MDDSLALLKEEMAELLESLEAALLELEQTPDDGNMLNQVFRSMHTIKGGMNLAGGLEDLAALTHEAETVFDAVRSGKKKLDRAILDLTFKAKDLMLAFVQENVQDKNAIDELVAGFRATLKAGAAKPQAEDQAVAPAEAAPEKGGAGAKDDASDYYILFKPNKEKLLPTIDPLVIINDLRQVAVPDSFHIIAHTENLPPLPDMDPETCYIWWEFILKPQGDKDTILDVFIFIEGQAEIKVEPCPDPEAKLAELVAKAESGNALPAPGSIKMETAKPAASPEPAKAAAPSAPAATSAPKAATTPATPAASDAGKAPAAPAAVAKPKKETASIRVDAYKLDDMVALVGELVIAQARLLQISSHLHDASLQNVAEEMALLSASLRDRTLSMRMLPIGTTFERFRRLVRDLSHDLSKEIALVTHGAETELDKTVIEQLGDPLVHLLRNSIDHGIEHPDARAARGKPTKGTLTLSAEHSGGYVLIKIADDGNGLNREKIAAKAVTQGLVQDASTLTDKEIYNLIFMPGFSTAEKVTNVSGRGVGMDVVKKSIDALRGSVEIESTPGKGSVVTIKLPLTLAIIEGLQVRVADEYFVLPLALIEECVELTKAQRGDEGKKIINLRDEIVPYIRLRDWFGIPGDKPDIEQIIITGSDGQHTGVVVDEVIGQQQTVIKNIGNLFKEVEEISGATVRGDGTLALILDVPTLCRKVENSLTEAV